MANQGSKRRILYFLHNGLMTAEHEAEVAKIAREGVQIMFRNAAFVPVDGPVEPADGVAGDVPARYRDVFGDPTKPEHATALSRGASPQRTMPETDPGKVHQVKWT